MFAGQCAAQLERIDLRAGDVARQKIVNDVKDSQRCDYGSELTCRATVIHSTPDGIVIDVRVIPRARRSGVAGERNQALLVRLQAPPVDGAANDELIDVIAAALGLPKRSVTIISGTGSRSKRVRIVGLDATAVRSRLFHFGA